MMNSSTIKKYIKQINQYTQLQHKKKLYYQQHPNLQYAYQEKLKHKKLKYLKNKIHFQQYHWKHTNKKFKKNFKNRYAHNQTINHLEYLLKAVKVGKLIRARTIGEDESISTISLLPKSFDTEDYLSRSISNHMQNATLNTKGMIATKLHYDLSLSQVKNIYDILQYNKFNPKYNSKKELLKYYCRFILNIKNTKNSYDILTIPVFVEQIDYINKIKQHVEKLLVQKTMFDFIQWYFIDYKYQTLFILPKSS